VPPIRYCEARVHHRMGGRVYLNRHAGRVSLPVPDDVNGSKESLLLPTLSWLTFTLSGGVLVWDVRDSKLLLNFFGGIQPATVSFSHNGRFLACGATSQEVYLWKESHVGDALHQRVAPNIDMRIRPLLSPNGESIIALSPSTVQLWCTTDPTPSISSVQTQLVEQSNYITEFSPDETLAAVAPFEGRTVTVLDLKSGNPRLTIDTGMKVLCLRITGSTIVVIGEGKVVTWNLPAEGCTLNVRANVNVSVRTTMFDYLTPCPIFPRHPPRRYTSVSPDLNRVATAERTLGMIVYDVPTGKRLASTPAEGPIPWSTPDGRDVWCEWRRFPTAEGWSIVEDRETGLTRLEPLEPTVPPSGGLPWRSPLGYGVTPDGWVLSTQPQREATFMVTSSLEVG